MRRLQLIDPTDTPMPADIPGGLRIAFATTDMKRVDAHFGSAPVLMIYEVGTDTHRLLEAVAFDEVSAEDGSGHEPGSMDRIEAKVQALKGCAMLFVHAIGGGAAARVVNNRIYPIKVPVPEAIASVIGRVQTMLNGTPPPWLRKILHKDEAAVDFAEE